MIGRTAAKSPALHALHALGVGVGVALLLLVAGCAHGEAMEAQERSIKVSGSLVYRARIALPAQALAIAELREAAAGDEGSLIDEHRIDLQGRQVPIAFELTAPAAGIEPGRNYAVRGAIFFAGLPRFASGPVPVSLAGGDVELGEIELQPFRAEPFSTDLECGGRTVRVSFLGDAMQLTAGDEVFRMQSVVAASGAKYEAEDDPSTMFWSKGGQAFVQVRGQALRACTLAAGTGAQPTAPATPLRARGNEPGWSLSIGDAEIELVTDYGATRATFPKPMPETSGDATRYVVADANQTITVLDRPCADTMSGMFYPLSVTVERPEGVLSGCGGEPASLLAGPEWVVESIDGNALVGDSRATITFREGGRVDGLASCNRYLATYELTGEGLSISGGASTMMACAPSLMEQERRFLDALAAVRRFEIAPDGALVLLADQGPKLIARR
jgi:heat shock protein HslJ/uncharacterized lipoprotein YbaY/membrane-bound inhibitor of C-type lysozyme